MSTKLIANADLIVKWTYYTLDPEEQNPCNEHNLLLEYTIRINGRLEEFEQSFELVKNGDKFELKNYREWYILENIITSIGYPLPYLNTEDTPAPEHQTIDSWIEACLDPNIVH